MVYVQGSVLNPGKYDIKKGSSSIQAIIQAGGFNYSARKKYWVRFNSDSTSKSRELDVIKILNGEQFDVVLIDGCVVQVLPDCWGIDPVGASTNELLKVMVNDQL